MIITGIIGDIFTYGSLGLLSGAQKKADAGEDIDVVEVVDLSSDIDRTLDLVSEIS